ncbi:hypothetical protein BDV12DRAFT_165168 [Aspergillus spectabilis]
MTLTLALCAFSSLSAGYATSALLNNGTNGVLSLVMSHSALGLVLLVDSAANLHHEVITLSPRIRPEYLCIAIPEIYSGVRIQASSSAQELLSNPVDLIITPE